MVDLAEYTLVTEPSREYLSERQIVDYRAERRECLEWLLTFGKQPDEASGYAPGTVHPRAARMDMFYRFVWTEVAGGYTVNLAHEHADAWMDHLARRDLSGAHKRNCVKAVKMLYKWLHHERGLEQWEPEFSFSRDDSTNPRDYLTDEERGKIREASLEYGAVPAYNSLVPEERDRWKQYLAQRFEKPKHEVSPDDWDRANGWKVPSLVMVSLDAALRPVEVERSRVSWVDPDNGVLRIPKEESSKNRDHWVVGLRDRSVDALARWLQQRSNYEMYDETEAIWLTREANPYNRASLRTLLHRLCEVADIDTEHRQMSWYALRHSTGTYLTREEDLAAAQAQLRHKSPQTTMKYDQAPVEDRKDALERMG